MSTQSTKSVASRNIKHLAQMELTGAGQVYVQGNYAYVGHLTNKDRLGTSILDISDPRKPRIVSQITLDDANSHSHKARVVGEANVGSWRSACRLPFGLAKRQLVGVEFDPPELIRREIRWISLREARKGLQVFERRRRRREQGVALLPRGQRERRRDPHRGRVDEQVPV